MHWFTRKGLLWKTAFRKPKIGEEVEELNTKYQTEKKEQEILLLTSQSQLAEERAKISEVGS